MKFEMYVRMGNAAFEDEPASELARILRLVADAVEAGTFGAPLHDINGNTCGRFDITGREGCP